jgi:hypothetical protein
MTCTDCDGTGSVGVLTCLNCGGTGTDVPLCPDVRQSLERSLAGHRRAAEKARRWLGYCEDCVEYYEEWIRTGEVPAWQFPEWEAVA